MRRECRERFPRHRGLATPTCIMARAWCMPGSLTRGVLWSRWRGKRSRHSRHMRNPQFYVSVKRPIAVQVLSQWVKMLNIKLLLSLADTLLVPNHLRPTLNQSEAYSVSSPSPMFNLLITSLGYHTETLHPRGIHQVYYIIGKFWNER